MRPSLIVAIIAAALLTAGSSAMQAQSLPVIDTDKVATTPNFSQQDRRGDFPDHGRRFCGPVAVSDSLMYLARHGYEKLLPPDTHDDLAQIEIIRTLAGDSYMRTTAHGGTNVSGLIWGVYKYVTEHGYTCRLTYEGCVTPRAAVRSAKIADIPDIAWIKSAVTDPTACVWLDVGLYARGRVAGNWDRVDGHVVSVVGYSRGGDAAADPNVLMLCNPDQAERLSRAAPASSDSRLPNDAVALVPAAEGVLNGNGKHPTVSAKGHFLLAGPGLPLMPHVDAAILDGAVVMVIGKR